jgi:hypothetical protein
MLVTNLWQQLIAAYTTQPNSKGAEVCYLIRATYSALFKHKTTIYMSTGHVLVVKHQFTATCISEPTLYLHELSCAIQTWVCYSVHTTCF